MTTPSDEDIATRLVVAINEAKSLTGITTHQLAVAYTEAAPEGEALSATNLTNILAGRRTKIGVAELIRFCYVLDLDPIDIVPELDQGAATTTRAKYRAEFFRDLTRFVDEEPT
jgi:hypothetical protein